MNVRFISSDFQWIQIDLVDVTGRISASLYSGHAQKGQNDIRIEFDSNQIPGMYLLKVSGKDWIAYQKILIRE